MFYIFFISLLFNELHATDINVVLLEDSDLTSKMVKNLVRIYNEKNPPRKINISIHCISGSHLTLDMLNEIHLVWCDIQMPVEHGDQTLMRILQEAKVRREAGHAGIRPPPFIALTMRN